MKVILPSYYDVISNTVVEDDANAWSVSPYAIGERVVFSHAVYECIKDIVDITITPEFSDAWAYVSPTNAWAMFDVLSSTKTTVAQVGGGSASISFTVRISSSSDAMVLFGLSCDSVVITANTTGGVTIATFTPPATIFDFVIDPVTLFAMPAAEPAQQILIDTLPLLYPLDVTVSLTASSVVELGAVFFGRTLEIGKTRYPLEVDYVDSSIKERNAWGVVSITKRPTYKRLSIPIDIENSNKKVFDKLNDYRAEPCVWIGSDVDDEHTVIGIFKDISVKKTGPEFSESSLLIEGFI